jgi:hypothetical protein
MRKEKIEEEEQLLAKMAIGKRIKIACNGTQAK